LLNISFEKKIKDKKIPIYFKNEYQNIFAKYDHSELIILKIQKNSTIFYLPLLIHPIDSFFEAYSSYGYGGFWSKSEDILLEEEFNLIKDFLSNQNIIDIFVRNSPFLENEKIIPQRYNSLNRTTYMVTLNKFEDFEEIKLKVNQKIRWAVNQAQKNSLKVERRNYINLTNKEFEAFYDMYIKAMEIRNADEYYFFSRDFFLQHFYNLKENCDLYLVKKNNVTIAGSIFLKDQEYVHYHFSAANNDYYKFQPMDLLILRAIFDYGNEGRKFMHLGGGLKLDASDGLSKFKKKFSDIEKNFYISKILINQEKYDYLKKKYNLEESHLFLIKDAMKK